MKAIIIEDELSGMIALENMLTDYCQGVEVVGKAQSVKGGVTLINKLSPTIVFLDIEMPNENGFELLTYFPEPKFEIIFTTAYSEYALKALKISAVDYLLKPIGLEDLRNAIAKVEKKVNSFSDNARFKVLKGNLNKSLLKLALPTTDGFEFVDIKNITYCEAVSNYTSFFVKDEEKIMVSKTLKLYSEILEEHFFFRISRAHLVNLRHVKKIGRQKNPTLTMEDGTVLNVSNSRKNLLLQVISELS